MRDRAESSLQENLTALARATDHDLVNMTGRIRVHETGEEIYFGGMFDTMVRDYDWDERWPDELACDWMVSEQQLRVLHFFEDRPAPRCVMIGGMGAGKTSIAARAAVLLATQFANADIGIIGPTQQKLGPMIKKFGEVLPKAWIEKAQWHALFEPPYVRLVNGVRFQFLGAKAPSKAMGSPIHGFDWVAAFIDEEQQVSDEAVADVIARGRDAPDGWYPILSTCTISDDPGFRARLANYRSDPAIDVHTLQVTANPFMPPEFIEQMKASMTPRQFNQRVLALEEPPERATYPDFDRRRHVRPVPQIGARDITHQVTGGRVLVGYDPGALCDVSVLLKCYLIGDNPAPHWWVMDEVVTRPGNPNKHSADLARYLWTQYRLKPEDVVIRADPHVSGEHGATDDTYAEVRLSGFKVQYAVYKKNASAAQAHRHGQLPKDARIQVVNTLLLNARNETRLFLDADERGRPKAQFVATSLEMSQRDDFGRAEMYKKGSDNDISHPTCALGYAIYRLEKARTTPAAVRVKQ